MSSPPPDRVARIDELLADLALEGLSPSEHGELADLLNQVAPQVPTARAFEQAERAAAAAHLAFLAASRATEPLPASLRARIEADAARMIADAVSTPRATSPDVIGRIDPTTLRQSVAPRSPSLAWPIAAAAMVIAAVSLSLNLASTRTRGAQVLPPDQRLSILASSAPDVIRVPWITPDGADAGGEVVWSTQRQEGYMVFKGLPVNDPTKEQYQLWIFDVNQDERFPLHGGVFDVTSAGEVVVPIDPHLHVVKPTLFAVTIEKPGGVWVSDRSRLPVLAKVAG